MRNLCVATAAALLACNLTGLAQTETACGQTLDAPLRSRAVLTIDSRSAGLEIVGTDHEAIHLSCSTDDIVNARHIRIRFTGNQDDAKLTITGGSLKTGNIQVRIEVPRKMSLRVQMPAGEVKVKDIAGDKDINLYAGQITISSARPSDYRSVNLSVDIGEVKAPSYGTQSGGFFPTFTKNHLDGEYSLHAHVITGEIDLFGTGARTTAE